MQIFVLAPDLTVLHALPGYWHPEDLARELRFGLVLARLYADDTRSLGDRRRMAALLHRAEVNRQPAETTARSGWQSFDQMVELQEAAAQATLPGGTVADTVICDDNGQIIGMKPINHLLHERLLEQLFVPWSEFDLPAFIDYGTLHYDLNAAHGRGREMPHL